MSTPTPISPPSSAPAGSSNEPAEPPVSPIGQTGFPHKTSAAVSTRTPFIDTGTPAINAAPVELDGVPTSPPAEKGGKKGKVVGLGEEDEIEAEFLGEGGRSAGGVVSEKRKAMLAQRGRDPGVIVDLPTEPTAEEVRAAKAMEGAVTPGVEREER
ncbi:hypothetical protein DPSP01_013857 [Paraphaeosphaeria sporulosa]|uniref:Uncharacterized protein n=1 Tax=Paraphaeosphaeria sporulosa TaxID=1460663 RepID=A0A177CP31_9PLEO|nr:uncharacterized protein CC84DRAFT_1215206 [Paraphaeosphaeria sporulosa]OAG08732.1 hypothetical protein CC84DRAFT_1215206 [Paraphaeosphaeria sporulosa]